MCPPQRPSGSGGGGPTAAAYLLGAGLAVVVLVWLAAKAYSIWVRRRMNWQNIAIWTLYDGEPTPGIYRPPGWLGSLRFRQGLLTAVIFVHVLSLRGVLGLIDHGIAAGLGRCVRILADGTAAQRLGMMMVLVPYGLSFVSPLYGVIALFSTPSDNHQIYLDIEASAPKDLYPDPEN